MTKAPVKLFVFDEDGNAAEILMKDYKKQIVEELKVKPYEGTEAILKPLEIVDTIITLKCAAIPADLPEELSNYTKLEKRIINDLDAHEKHVKSVKEAAEGEAAKKKAEKEAAKKKEEEALALAEKRQGVLQAGISSGFEAAEGQFIEELNNLKGSLPSGVKLTAKKDGNGIGVVLEKGIKEEDLGNALGQLMGRQDSSAFMANSLQFVIGDLLNASVEMGIYASGIKGGQAISKFLMETSGKSIVGRMIESYGRMARRVPTELRNPRVDPTAYLCVSDAKVPAKKDGEDDKAYEKRKKEFEANRKEVLKKLAKGEVTKRKEVVPLVEELAYNAGTKERPDPNVVKMTTKDWLDQYFHCNIAIRKLLGKHTEGVVTYVSKSGKLYELDKEQLTTMRDEAESNLCNIYGYDEAVFDGKRIIEKQVLTGKNKETKENIYRTDKVEEKAYPATWFAVDESEETEAPEKPEGGDKPEGGEEE